MATKSTTDKKQPMFVKNNLSVAVVHVGDKSDTFLVFGPKNGSVVVSAPCGQRQKIDLQTWKGLREKQSITNFNRRKLKKL